MKRLTTVALGLAIAAALAMPAHSQAQMTVGLGGGIVAATFSGDDAEDLFGSDVSKGSRVGLNIGANIAIPIAERFAIVPGAYFVQKGAQYSADGVTGTFKGDYIEIPILISAMLTGPESSLGFNIFAGPTFAFEAGCSFDLEGDGSSSSSDCDDEGFDDRQKLDMGLAGGAGVSFPITETLSLMISAGYELGLRKLDTSDDPADLKNSAFFGDVHVGIPVG